jgi:nucleoside-diphosphate-sugar epimerase
MILVTGGAGMMGRRLASALRARGHRTRVLCLPGDAAAEPLREKNVEIAFGDVTRAETLAPALQGVETVYHLAALILSPGDAESLRRVNAEGTRNVAAAAEAAGADHFILVSSVSVLYPWSNAYAQSKRAAESHLRATRIPHVTVVRPSLAYEDGGSVEFMRFVAHIRRPGPVLLPGGGRARKSPVHVDDLVEGFLALAGNPKAYGKTYHFTGGETITLRAMAQALLAHMGCRKPILGVPVWLCFFAALSATAWARLTGRRNLLTVQSLTGLVQDAAPEDPSVREDLGYNPRPFREGLATLVSLKNCLRP